MAGGFSLLLGAGALVAGIAIVTTALIDRVGRILNRWQVPILFQQVVGAAMATGVTIGLEAVGRLPAATAPSLVVAANIVALLSGLATGLPPASARVRSETEPPVETWLDPSGRAVIAAAAAVSTSGQLAYAPTNS